MKLEIMKNTELGCELQLINIDGEPWFKGISVAKALGYIDPDQAIRKFVDDEDKKRATDLIPVKITGIKNVTYHTKFINESGLYSLILSSKLPASKKFKRWVTSEVLPSIRRTSKYEMNQPINLLEERKMKLEEMKVYSQLYKDIDDAKLRSSIKDFLHNAITDSTPQNKLIENKTNPYAKELTVLIKENFGFVPNNRQSTRAGILIKKEYVEEYDKDPERGEKYVNGDIRKVNVYPKDCEEWIIETLDDNQDYWNVK